MVDDKSTDNLIRWSSDGTSFLVEKHQEFAKTVLPRFYKHNTFASFVRQLNMYDFHKIPHIQQNVMIIKSEHQIWEFSHPNFQRERLDLLILVNRKKNKDKESDNEINLVNLVDDLSVVKKTQTNIQNQLANLHCDNEILWQETLSSREKHQGHQEAIEKILLFLISVFPDDKLSSGIPKDLIEQAASLAGVSMEQASAKLFRQNHAAGSSTMSDLSQTLDNATRSAQIITQDIDSLQVSLRSLANNIGINPAHDEELGLQNADNQNNNNSMLNFIHPYLQESKPSGMMKPQERQIYTQLDPNNSYNQYDSILNSQENFNWDIQNDPDLPTKFYNKR